MMEGKMDDHRDMIDSSDTSPVDDNFRSLMRYLDGCEVGSNSNDDDTEVDSARPIDGAKVPVVIASNGTNKIMSRVNASNRALLSSGPHANDENDAKGEPSGQKKWLWDEWEEGSLVEGDNALATKSERPPSSTNFDGPSEHKGGTLENGDNVAMGRQLLENLNAKVASMQAELDGESRTVKSLQSALMRKKVINDRRLKRMTESWDERVHNVRAEHERSSNRQAEFIAQVQNDCKKATEQKEGLGVRLQQIKESLPSVYETVKSDCTKELKCAQREWQAEETRRLAKLAHTKTSSMKKDAAKALEPELERLMSENRSDLTRLREKIVVELDELKVGLVEQNEAKLRQDVKNMEASMDSKLEDLRKANKKQVSDAERENEAELQGLQLQWKSKMSSELELFEAERFKCQKKQASELKSIQATSFNEQSMADHQKEMSSIQRDREDKLEKTKADLYEKTNHWRPKRKTEMQRDIQEREGEMIEELRTQCDVQLKMVQSRLQDDSKTKYANLHDEAERQIGVVRNDQNDTIEKNQAEQETLLQQLAAATDKINLLKEETETLHKLLAEEKGRLQQHEEQLKRMQLENFEVDFQQLVTNAQEKAQHDIQHALGELRLVEGQLDALRSEMEAVAKTREAVVVDVTHRHELERTRIDEKINTILETKKNDMAGMAKILLAKQTECRANDEELELIRKKSVCLTQ